LEGAFTLEQVQTAFATGMVLGAAVCFVLGILVGMAWATMKKPKGSSQ
jgi:hypothetical protein